MSPAPPAGPAAPARCLPRPCPFLSTGPRRGRAASCERGREGPRGGERLLRKARRHEAPFAAVPVCPQHVCSRLSLRAVSHRGPEFGGFFSVLRAGGSRTAQVADRDSAAPPAARAGTSPQAPAAPRSPGASAATPAPSPQSVLSPTYLTKPRLPEARTTSWLECRCFGSREVTEEMAPAAPAPRSARGS